MSITTLPVMRSALEIKQRFERILQYDYLQGYIDNTRPDADELWLVYTILTESEPPDRAGAITLAWGFAHAGLLVHDLVSLHNTNEEFAKKKRQLNVLAGDFYSALYYQALARVHAVDMIELFGSTLQEVYEKKIASHLDKDNSFETRLVQTEEIEALLAVAIAKAIGQEGYEPLLRPFFLYKRLEKEKENAKAGCLSPLIEAWTAENRQGSLFKVEQQRQLEQLQEAVGKQDNKASAFIKTFLEKQGGSDSGPIERTTRS